MKVKINKEEMFDLVVGGLTLTTNIINLKRASTRDKKLSEKLRKILYKLAYEIEDEKSIPNKIL